MKSDSNLHPSSPGNADASNDVTALDDDLALVRRRLLARRLQEQRAQQALESKSPEASGAMPLSHAQEGLWFLDLLADGSTAYHIHSVTRLQGPLDIARIDRAVRGLIARHASLRTEFHATESGPVQQVLPATQALDRFQLACIDLRAHAGRDATVDERIAASIARPFDLSRAPLLRAELLRTADDTHLLVLVVHHIVADGWSMSIINRELGALYSGGELAAEHRETLGFCEHARQHRERLARGDMQADLAHWRENLRDLQTLQLPTDKLHTPHADTEGQTLSFHLDAELCGALKALARQHDATLFMALLAAFQALLMRYTGQADIAIGVPVAGRGDARVRDVVGYFVNTVVMRGDLEGEPSFVDLLQRSRRTTLDALAHQEIPFETLVSELSPVRDASRNPLYQVAFALESFKNRVLALEGLASERLGVHSRSAKFDLSLTFIESGDQLAGEIEYRTSLFEAGSIDRMARHFRRLLAAMVAEPQRDVQRLALMDAAEQARLLVEWNHSERRAAHDLPVHAHFRAQAARTPHSIALRFGHHSMTYAKLDALSDQLARELQRRGVEPEAVVGLCMKRCLGLVVGLLGILKSGATLLPLDPDHPPERLQAMLADAAPRIVLAQATVSDVLRRLDAASLPEIIDVPVHGGEMPRDAMPAVPDRTHPQHLAYLIYTSGSTGLPKAAQLTHRGLSNHVLWMNDALRLASHDRVLQKTAISFDASLWEFVSPLICGAELVLAQPEVHRDMPQLAATLRDQDISVVQFVPSEMRVILGEEAMAHCPSLRYVLCGGEALDRALALTLRQTLPGVTLGNFYGPSEATVDSAWYELGDSLPDRRIVPIGRPIANAQLYVLDAHLQPQPINVAGELYVGGLGVGRGYLNRPELSAEKFLPNPFRPGERMYRTGDQARWLNDGVVEFIGRNDDQVKLRGFRIELGEIEAGINSCQGVGMSAVLLREDVPGRKELVAWVAGNALDPDALRTELRSRLPDYMIPAAFVFLPELPRLASGKVDRRALGRMGPAASHSRSVAPRSPLESVLLEIWQTVLAKSGFGVRDNFFDLGGHSLLATQVVSRIGATFKVDLPLRNIFEHPTIEQLAWALGSLLADTSPAASSRLPIVPVSRAKPSLVSFSQRRMWSLHEMDPQGAAYNMRESLRLRGPLQRDALRAALDELVARHEAFRTTFELADTEPMAIVGPRQPAVFIEVDAREWPQLDRDAEFERRTARIAAKPFDLARGPLHRFILVQRGEDDHALVLVMHHIVGDDWSWGILLRELQALYGASVLGTPLPAPARAI
ncbi:MAG: amino acid adenylation domain-containing protein, partial [Variovorax sp.]